MNYESFVAMTAQNIEWKKCSRV